MKHGFVLLISLCCGLSVYAQNSKADFAIKFFNLDERFTCAIPNSDIGQEGCECEPGRSMYLPFEFYGHITHPASPHGKLRLDVAFHASFMTEPKDLTLDFEMVATPNGINGVNILDNIPSIHVDVHNKNKAYIVCPIPCDVVGPITGSIEFRGGIFSTPINSNLTDYCLVQLFEPNEAITTNYVPYADVQHVNGRADTEPHYTYSLNRTISHATNCEVVKEPYCCPTMTGAAGFYCSPCEAIIKSFSWSDGGFGQARSGLEAGVYTVSIETGECVTTTEVVIEGNVDDIRPRESVINLCSKNSCGVLQILGGNRCNDIVNVDWYYDVNGNGKFDGVDNEEIMPGAEGKCFSPASMGSHFPATFFALVTAQKIDEETCDVVQNVTERFDVTMQQSPNPCKNGGINISNDQEPIAVWPQPMSDVLHIKGIGLVNNSELLLHDISGRIVLKKTITSDNVTLNMSGIPAGIYVLTLANVNGLYHRQTILKE